MLMITLWALVDLKSGRREKKRANSYSEDGSVPSILRCSRDYFEIFWIVTWTGTQKCEWICVNGSPSWLNIGLDSKRCGENIPCKRVWWFLEQNAAGATQDKAKEVAGAAGDKANQASDVAGQKWEDTKQATAGTTQDKANEAGNVAGEKWEQTKLASSDAAQAKDGAGSLLQQAGDALGHAYRSVKETAALKQ